ncbi:MAG TPA: TolC family protein [Kiritimatiellia bacterium]|nr:TolC family protein [Kiritimatiellia bacterium]HMO97976.1 TolC family protein [Kiritimatiellia bacterium]HMP95327.1 TolC family protein [Kiritimatiellia bacterium]
MAIGRIVTADMVGYKQIFAGALLALASGCYSARSLDRYVEREVERVAEQSSGISREVVVDSVRELSSEFGTDAAMLDLDRDRVLAVAAVSSRTLQTRREDLYRAGLNLFGTRRDFGPNVSGVLEYVYAAPENSTERQTLFASLAAEQILPTGGRIRAAGSQTVAREDREADGNDRFSGRASLRLDQPLLSGAGRSSSHEPLIQAERDYVYALRRFTLERQDFAINILRDYYNLLGQRNVVENTRTNHQQFIFLRQRSEALFQVNRAPAIDVLRSQQEELSALNRLTTAEEAYRIQVGRFLVQLGLPADHPVSLADDIPVMRPVTLEEKEAVGMALENRLDVMTVRDQLEDARRKLAVARQSYLPEINAFGIAEWDADDATSLGDQSFDSSWQAGVRAELPLDRRAERDAVRVAEINLAAAQRRWDEFQETTALEVRDSYSQLRSLTVSVEIQLRNIEIAEKRAANALLQFRNGRLSNRDVVEAANDLLGARNSYISALADYEIQRLTLLRQIGRLDVSREGAIVEWATP